MVASIRKARFSNQIVYQVKWCKGYIISDPPGLSFDHQKLLSRSALIVTIHDSELF